MSMPHCDTRPHQRQYASVFAGIYTPTYRYPMDMRSLLKALMALRDENVAGAGVGWSVAAVVAVALYRAQR